MPRRTFLPTFRLPVAAAVAAALLLAGCSSGGSPSANPTTTAAPAPGGSAGPSESSGPPTVSATGAYKPADAQGKAQNVPVPVMPALARENTKEGLEAFIRYWYAQQNFSIETGDLAGWTHLYRNTCATCGRIATGIKDSYVKGRWSAGGKIHTPVIEVLWVDGAEAQQSKVQVVQDQADYYNADGSMGRPPESASNSAFGIFTVFEANEWTVSDLGLIN